jgi:predicted nucleic acid-binding protein
MRMFFDANVLSTAAHNPRGKAALVITLGSEVLFQLATSAYAREEARRNLERKAPDRLAEFTRSLEALEHLARWRGAQVGVEAAEAFCLLRQLV